MSTPPANDVDARTNVYCSLRRGICCLKFLKLLRSGCRQSTTGGVHHSRHQEQETISLNLVLPDENSHKEADDESLDSERPPSQESNVDSCTELLVINAHRTSDVVPPRVKFSAVPPYVRELFPNPEEDGGPYKPSVSKAQLFPESQKCMKPSKHEYPSCPPKPSKKWLDDVSIDCIDEKSPSDVTANTDLKVSSISIQYNI